MPVDLNDDYKLIATKNEFVAGDAIVLKFSTTGGLQPLLYASYSYGNTIIKPVTEVGMLNYNLPQTISSKSGVVNWKLLADNQTLSGKCHILPKTKAISMETYLGPPSIAAGRTDFSMLVVIPTDRFDNPLQDSTAVNVKHQFLNNEENNTVYIKNGISYKNIFSETKTGRMLISSECLGKNSKEFTLNVLPDLPTDFEIYFDRNHQYADGNQITSFTTSIIKDNYGNIVSDGTYAAFFISNKSKAILKTSGTTINGIASAKMIHPDHEDSWKVKAIIEGMAKSNTIELDYKPALLDFQVVFSEDNRTITIGPLKSFMNQMIPDGLEVSLSVFKNKTKHKTLLKSSFGGYATFKLNTNDFTNDIYNFKIETAGIEKPFKQIKL